MFDADLPGLEALFKLLHIFLNFEDFLFLKRAKGRGMIVGRPQPEDTVCIHGFGADLRLRTQYALMGLGLRTQYVRKGLGACVHI